MNPYETDLPGEINDTIPCEDYWDQDFINEAELDIVVNNEDGTAKVVDSVSEQEYPKTFASGKDAADYFYKYYRDENGLPIELVDFYDLTDADDGSEEYAAQSPNYYKSTP